MGVSVITVTLNEEKNIGECLESVKWADELVVVDSRSFDRTGEIARKHTSHVHVIDWLGYGETKNFALRQASHEWILWLDADERVSPDLAREIQSIVRSAPGGHSGYRVARRAFFLGKWIRHCGWYPGYVVRLFRKEGAKFSTTRVHERLETGGTVGTLANDLIHYTDDDLFHYFDKFNRYTSLAAQDVRQSGKQFSLADVLLRPPFLFFKMYILRLGFLDGVHGLILSLVSAAYVFTKYGKLWELERADRTSTR